LLGSTRSNGNTEALARHAARALPASDEQRWLRLTDHPLPAFMDTRHSTGFEPLDGNSKLLCDATLAATDLVFVTPVYWYSVAWPIKLYLDHWSSWMRQPALDFKAALAGRSLWAVLVDSDDEALHSSSPAIDTLHRTADYMGMHWRGALVGHGNRPGEIERDSAALAAAATYFTVR
jgi:multimeric flavodoxin WrbA